MEFENAVAKTFEVINNKIAISETMRIEFENFKEEIISEIDLLMTQNRLADSDRFEERELIRGVTELKQEVKNLQSTCNSLYNVMRSFK